METLTLNTFFWAFVGGVLPALLWLWFWLKEDAKKPEPRRLIAAAFLGGIIIIPIALFLERSFHVYVPEGPFLITIWAIIEEVLKYAVAYFVAFRAFCIDKSLCLDEPVDPLIYLITVAIGFAAIENTLFLLEPLSNGDTIATIVTGDLRFIGATLLHIVASGAIGVAMSLTYYKRATIKRIAIWIGLFTAVVLHILFNLSIIKGNGDNLFIIFGFLWIGVIILLLFFEKTKALRV